MRVYYSIIKHTHVHPPFKKSGYGPESMPVGSQISDEYLHIISQPDRCNSMYIKKLT